LGTKTINKKMNKTIISSYIHALFCWGIALFFIYAGVKKFIPKERPIKMETVQEWIKAVENDQYERPTSFFITMKMMRVSGFFKMIGFLQIASGLLILFPHTRFIGLGLLLPITINIFTLHLFMDNRMDENLETGLFLILNLSLLFYYKNAIKKLLNVRLN